MATGVVRIPFFPPPDRARRLYMLASSVLHYGYYFFLLRAYRFGDGPRQCADVPGDA